MTKYWTKARPKSIRANPTSCSCVSDVRGSDGSALPLLPVRCVFLRLFWAEYLAALTSWDLKSNPDFPLIVACNVVGIFESPFKNKSAISQTRLN